MNFCWLKQNFKEMEYAALTTNARMVAAAYSIFLKIHLDRLKVLGWLWADIPIHVGPTNNS